MMNPTYSAEPTDNALHAPQPTSTDAKPENRWAKAWGRERQLAETTLRECGNTHASALRVLVGCLWTWDTVLVVLSAVLGIAFFNNYKYVARPNGIPPRYLMDGWIGAIGRAVRCPKSNNTRALYRQARRVQHSQQRSDGHHQNPSLTAPLPCSLAVEP
jgi:hypothetical protein